MSRKGSRLLTPVCDSDPFPTDQPISFLPVEKLTRPSDVVMSVPQQVKVLAVKPDKFSPYSLTEKRENRLQLSSPPCNTSGYHHLHPSPSDK